MNVIFEILIGAVVFAAVANLIIGLLPARGARAGASPTDKP